MSKFKDNKGRTWTLEFHVPLVKQLEARIEGFKFEPLLRSDSRALVQLFDEPVKLVRVLWIMVEEQAEVRGVSPEGFGGSLGGGALDGAGEAFTRALVAFAPRWKRSIFDVLVTKAWEGA